jgi:hypothetical protein
MDESTIMTMYWLCVITTATLSSLGLDIITRRVLYGRLQSIPERDSSMKLPSIMTLMVKVIH